MKSLVLVKQHSSVQLGHLYEHLFMRRVNTLLFERGAYKVLDYAAVGTTYDQCGVITVEFDAYTAKACQQIPLLRTLQINLGTDNVNVAIALDQISAEELQRFGSKSPERIIQSLDELDRTPWQDLDDVSAIDTAGIRRNNSLLYLSDQPHKKPHTVLLSLRLDEQFASTHRMLLPLFFTVGRMILLTIDDQLCYTFGLYNGHDPKMNARTSSITSRLLASPQPATPISLVQLTDVAKQTAARILSSGVSARIAAELSAADYKSASELAPNIASHVIATRILVGSKGWREIATTKNIDAVIAHISLVATYRKDRTISRL